jgi:hypothetical protein
MADFFGTEQNRVLDVKDRNLDNVVFQYKHPPLTSEWNLINQIGNEKLQNLAKMSLPSGWLNIGEVFQDSDEANATVGSVYCSSAYTTPTTFKLFSLGNNYAIVNGWPILVQATDNIIRLDEPPYTQYNNFVFLEVWRKLVGTNEFIYPYGNVNNAPYSDNEIEWDAIGCETTKRVQLQYRIRSVKVSSLADCTKEIFDNNSISPIGGRTTEAVLQSFGKFGTTDPGLYVAGDGSDSSKEYLGTVDGYVYAIPMFLVHRRNFSEHTFTASAINTTAVSHEMVVAGYRSDRPDNKISDIVYKEDLIDLRHQVMVSNDLKNVVDKTISKLISGDLSTVYKKGFAEGGSATAPSSGGSVILKVERVNSVSGDNIPDIGVGSNTQDNVFKRRAFCNAELTHQHNIIEIVKTGSIWTEETFTIASKISLPEGEIISVDGFYSPDQGLVSGVSSDGTNITIADTGSYSIVGTSVKIFMEFTFKYHSSSYGFKDVPREFVEINKNDTLAIATRDNDVLLKYNNSAELLDFGASSGEPGYPGDISQTDRVHYCGGVYTECSNFGHELILNRTAVNGIVNLSLTNYKYNQYYIYGVKAVDVDGELVTFDVELTSGNCIVTISTLLSVPSQAVTLKVYTGSRIDTYSVGDSFKFFELSKQGMGIVDTYEMIMVTASLDVDKYVVDTGNKLIVKIATTAVYSGDDLIGTPFVYNSSGEMVHISPTINDMLPVVYGEYTTDYLPTKIRISVSGVVGDIKVPVLVQSYVASTEVPYNFYYKTVPYQGMLNTSTSSIFGKVLGEGSAIISSSGSGAITDYSYEDGLVQCTSGSRTVYGSGTEWLSYVNVNDYFRCGSDTFIYRIVEVVSDTQLTLAELYLGATSIDSTYKIVRKDVPSDVVSNTVNRLPALSMESTVNITDYTCYSDYLDTNFDTELYTFAKRKLQDPLNAIINDFSLGLGTDAKRGRNDFQMTTGGNVSFKVGNGRPYLVYPDTWTLPAGHNKKVYQFYIFSRSGKGYQSDSGDMGKVYLMVVASESKDDSSNKLNPFTNKDVVDIFELVGRPIIRG